MTLVVKLFCLLLDRSEDYVNGLMQRKLGGQRKGFIRKVLVSYEKDFALERSAVFAVSLWGVECIWPSYAFVHS